jgi:hypothetical protein
MSKSLVKSAIKNFTSVLTSSPEKKTILTKKFEPAYKAESKVTKAVKTMSPAKRVEDPNKVVTVCTFDGNKMFTQTIQRGSQSPLKCLLATHRPGSAIPPYTKRKKQ